MNSRVDFEETLRLESIKTVVFILNVCTQQGVPLTATRLLLQRGVSISGQGTAPHTQRAAHHTPRGHHTSKHKVYHPTTHQ